MPKRKITDIKEIEGIIGRAACCHIGLSDGSEPYVVPVYFGYENNVLYFHSSPRGRKVDIINKNNRVCFQMETDMEMVKAEKPCSWTAKYRSVMGTGRASFLQSDAEKAHGLEVIMRHYADGDFRFPKDRLDKTLVVRIDVDSISGKALNYPLD